MLLAPTHVALLDRPSCVVASTAQRCCLARTVLPPGAALCAAVRPPAPPPLPTGFLGLTEFVLFFCQVVLRLVVFHRGRCQDNIWGSVFRPVTRRCSNRVRVRLPQPEGILHAVFRQFAVLGQRFIVFGSYLFFHHRSVVYCTRYTCKIFFFFFHILVFLHYFSYRSVLGVFLLYFCSSDERLSR